MEPDILLKLEKVPGYKEGNTVAIAMCSVCKLRTLRGCTVYGIRPQNITHDYEQCEKVVLDKTAISYPKYMELYGHRHKDEG